jgi:hypothetical protein
MVSTTSSNAANAVAVAPTTATERHWMNRLSSGATPALTAELRAAGGPAKWFELQLAPGRIGDTFAGGLRSWFPQTQHDAPMLWKRHKMGLCKLWEVAADLQSWTLLRRIHSKRQVHEVMVDFWSNLLHVPSADDKSYAWRWDYDAVIRKHALGTFEQLLQAAITHPAMGCYLDNAQSSDISLNENLGRELLELHTVGVGVRYTEDDVKMSARILTGYNVDMWDTFQAWYSPYEHFVGPVRVMGFSDPNGAADGRAVTARYLSYLARHPATGRRIARRLCVRLVSDEPSAALVTAVAKAYLASGTDIKATLRALVRHPDFLASAGAKVRTPVEDAVAMYRSLGVRPVAPTQDGAFATDFHWLVANMGQQPFDWPRPDGAPDVAEAWSGVSRVLRSFEGHHSAAAGWWPSADVTYRDETTWLRGLALPCTLDLVTDHISRQLLCRPATGQLQSAVAARLGLARGYPVRTIADMPMWRLEYVLAAALNSPHHLHR